MAQIHRLPLSGDEEQELADRKTASLAALALTLFIVVVGLFVLHQLAATSAAEDCLLAGRSNCDIVMARLP